MFLKNISSHAITRSMETKLKLNFKSQREVRSKAYNIGTFKCVRYAPIVSIRIYNRSLSLMHYINQNTITH